MAAFNWIRFEHECPACRRSALVRAKTHVGAAFDGDEEGGNFCNRTYGLGERLSWYPPDDPRHAGWRAGGRTLGALIQEACLARCERCDAALCAVVSFRDLRVHDVAQLTLEEEWPRGFGR